MLIDSPGQAALADIRLEGVRAGRFLPSPDSAHEIAASPIVDDARAIGPAVLFRGDCRRIAPLLENIDSCVTDPPYELGFMGRSWDKSGVASAWETWGAIRIALKPGAHLCAFAGARTYHRIAAAIDNAGFEVRDQIMWVFGSGFPKSLDISKELDKQRGGGVWRGRAGSALLDDPKRAFGQHYERADKGAPVSPEAIRWDGWGTALKPAHEPVCFARKPLSEATVAANVLRWATGGLNVDAGRVDWQNGADFAAAAAAAAARVARDTPGRERWAGSDGKRGAYGDPAGSLATWQSKADLGRWPANVATDGSIEVIEAFPPSARDAVRFFYSAKADKAEREEGLSGRDQRARAPRANIHPTVKPVDLMRWLCRLTTAPGGVILDPFLGSGSTGVAALREGFSFVGVEQDADYFEIACARVAHAWEKIQAAPDLVREISRAVAEVKAERQGDLF